MQIAHARARAMVDDAEREIDEMLEAARAAGRGIVAEAEDDAHSIRSEAILQRDKARALLDDAKQLVARAHTKRAPLQPPKANGHRRSNSRLDLNAASAEDLRAAGLSLTQARRVVARREREGAYSAVEQLAELPGMPAPLFEQVRSRLKV
jgi:competence ComEA-like helix-hairpin-helix protein